MTVIQRLAADNDDTEETTAHVFMRDLDAQQVQPRLTAWLHCSVDGMHASELAYNRPATHETANSIDLLQEQCPSTAVG